MTAWNLDETVEQFTRAEKLEGADESRRLDSPLLSRFERGKIGLPPRRIALLKKVLKTEIARRHNTLAHVIASWPKSGRRRCEHVKMEFFKDCRTGAGVCGCEQQDFPEVGEGRGAAGIVFEPAGAPHGRRVITSQEKNGRTTSGFFSGRSDISGGKRKAWGQFDSSPVAGLLEGRKPVERLSK